MPLIQPSSSSNITLATARTNASRANVNGIPAKFGMTLAVLDMLAFYLAALLSSLMTLGIERFILHVIPYMLSGFSLMRENIYLALSLGALTIFFSKGLYTRRMPWLSQVQYIGKVTFLFFLIDGFISFALKIHESRLLIAFNWMFAFTLIVLFRRIAFRKVAQYSWWNIPTVIIGNNAAAADLVYAFSADPSAGYDVRTVFLRDRNHRNFDFSSLPQDSHDIEVRNGLLEYDSYISQNPDYFYVISLDAFRGETREQLLAALDDAEATYAIVPSITRIGLYEMEPQYFFGHDIMMLQVRTADASALSGGRIIKRTMDVLIASLALVALAPLFTVVAILLKAEGQGGTVLYGGRRVGKGGRFFKCWKFRSMEPDSDHLLNAYLEANPLAKEDWQKYRKLPDDPRVTTRTARFIRKFSIDELPQLWNVLMGDMSLVGPRPILEDEQFYFGDMLKEYFSVRPGLTGLWQVSGRNSASFMRRVYWDSWYVRNWSLWSDIVILIKTPIALLNNRCAHHAA